MLPVEGRSRLFHAIVAVGAALGSACGGGTLPEHPSESLDASNDDAGRDAASAPEAAFHAPMEDAPSDLAADAGFAAPIAPDADICDQPGSNGKPCSPPDAHVPGCCFSGAGCFPCYV